MPVQFDSGINLSHSFDLTKSYLLQSELSEDDKRLGLNLLSLALEATNGGTIEDKIQKMTEITFQLISWQMRHLMTINRMLDKKLEAENLKKCEDCLAMKHAKEIQKEEEQQEILDEYLKSIGVDKEKIEVDSGNNKVDLFKSIFTKPYVYIFMSIAVFSPFAAEIIKTILSIFGN